MRVLLTQHCPEWQVGGTQTFNQTLRAWLLKEGHQVTIGWHCPPGYPRASERFDLAICSQRSTFPRARSSSDKVIFVSHGPGRLEVPDPGADAYAFVSEEVATKLMGVPYIWDQPHEIVRQPVDLETFAPLEGEPDVPTDVLRFTSARGPFKDLEDVCQEAGYRLSTCSMEGVPARVAALVQRARVVVAVGRCAVEAMACGVEVVIADDREYNLQPVLDTRDYQEWKLTNYSGRGGMEQYDRDRLAQYIKAAVEMPLQGLWRQVASLDHDVNDIAPQLLGLVQ